MLSRPQVTVARLVAASLAVLMQAACDGPGNSGVFTPDPSIVRGVPWFNGVEPARDNGVVVIPAEPVYPPIGFGVPDRGSQRTDCSPLADYEFSKGWFEDMEVRNKADALEVGVAGGWASYDDLSKYAFHTPGDATWYPGLMGRLGWGWGLPAERLPGPVCNGVPNEWVLHFRGGLFRRWGGGVSHAFMDPVGRFRDSPYDDCKSPLDDFCPPKLAPTATVDTAGLPTMAANGDPYLQSHDFFDVSSYDGVAFWARRGPEGFDRALVILTDKFTSGRLARENQTFCKRVKECHTRCLSGAPCSPDDPNSPNPIYRCFDPALGPLPTANEIPIETQLEAMYPRCGPSACTSPSTYVDLDFEDKACRPYTYPAGEESGEFCWNPGDPPPPGRDERCQDGWQTSVPLTPDWKFYAIPFTQFGQAQFGKRAPYMDLKSLDTIAFGAVMGWSDMYFDNVTFYRRKK
jgi:hypothetical protein